MLDYTAQQHIANKYQAPLFKTPFTDYLLHARSMQYKTDCAPYELMYSDCLEAYGQHKGLEKCRMILNDMHECVFRIKRIRRVLAMEKERDRQVASGERKEKYPPGPPLDLY